MGTGRASGREGLGNNVEVYDAEILALARGLKCGITYADSLVERERAQTVILFSDNTLAVQTISTLTPRSSQNESERFIDLTMAFLERNGEHRIETAWVPGHRGIRWNDRVDEKAKEACTIEPTIPKTSIAHHYRSLKANLVKRWKTLWANKPHTG